MSLWKLNDLSLLAHRVRQAQPFALVATWYFEGYDTKDHNFINRLNACVSREQDAQLPTRNGIGEEAHQEH